MSALAASYNRPRQTVTDYYIVLRLDGKPAMADAEAWIDRHIRGPWRCRFLGYVEQTDQLTMATKYLIEVGFYFRRIEDLERFRVHFLRLKPKLRLQQRDNPKRRGRGFWSRLLQ